jgi:nitroreductase
MTTESLAAADVDLGTVDWLLSTTRTVRNRLDLTRPVEREVIEECLQLAVYAPNAEARQNWRWFVIADPERRRVLADYYQLAWTGHNREGTGTRRGRWRDRSSSRRTYESARWLAEHVSEVPVLVIPCVLGKPVTEHEVEQLEISWRTAADNRYQPQARLVADATFYGSIFPAIWSFQLALRSRGLGSSITTMHLPFHQFVADELGIPRHATQIALLPVAYTRGVDFRPAPRVPARELTYWDEWERPRADESLRRALIQKSPEEQK